MAFFCTLHDRATTSSGKKTISAITELNFGVYLKYSWQQFFKRFGQSENLGDSWCWDGWGLVGPVAFVDLERSFAFVGGNGVLDAFVDEVFQDFVLDTGLDGQFLDDDVFLGHTFSVDESRLLEEAIDEALQKYFKLVLVANTSNIKLT